VLEQREREPVLVALERPVRLADDHAVKAAIVFAAARVRRQGRAVITAVLVWGAPRSPAPG
jgi:hypothetical protein